jgi:hypothetical protein
VEVGRYVKVKQGTMSHLRERGYVADYMTDSVDEQIGKIVSDHREVLSYPHFGVDLGFEQPVGISEQFLELI